MKTQAIFTVLVLSLASIASAQTMADKLYVPQNVTNTTATTEEIAGYSPGGYGGWKSTSSTLEEGALRGAGEYVRSWGDYNLNTSRAMINGETARAMSLENQKRNAERFFAMRRLNAEAMAAERGPRATPEALARYAREAAPNRLSNYQYEPSLGKIFWPQSLRGDEFAAERTLLENFARSGELNVRNKNEIRHAVAKMTETLKGQITEVESSDYLMAKKFLASLDFESRFANAPTNVASR